MPMRLPLRIHLTANTDLATTLVAHDNPLMRHPHPHHHLLSWLRHRHTLRAVAVLLLTVPEAGRESRLVSNHWRPQAAVLVRELIGTGKAVSPHPILMRLLQPLATIGPLHMDARHLASRTVLIHRRLVMVHP